MSRTSVTIIGTGSLGSALAKALFDNHYTITSLFNRRMRKAEAIAREVGATYFSEFPESSRELGSMIFLTVQDSEIEHSVDNLCRITDDFSGCTVVHCSGSIEASVLAPLEKKGASIAAFHPLQTFTSDSGTQEFRNIYFDVEADDITYNRLRNLADHLGGRTIRISSSAKPYLHAAAVMSSNYLVTLLEVSGKIAALGGIDKEEAMEAMLPLIRTTLQNLESKSTANALTGPIKRGDAETVRLHLELLKSDTDLLETYKKLGMETLQLAKETGSLPGHKKSELYDLLKDDT